MDSKNKKDTDRIRDMHSKGQMLHSASYYKSKDRHDNSKSKALHKAGEEHRTKKERYENTLRIGKEASEHFQK